MGISRQTWLVAGGLTVVLGLGSLVLVWPGYRLVHQVNVRMTSLQDKVRRLDDRTAEVELLATRVEELKNSIGTELRHVPESADIAGLFRRLSLPVDGVTVRDQTFAAGQPTSAVAGSDHPTRAVPITVDMEATFDSIYALLRSAESTRRLVRVSGVTIACERPDDGSDSSFLSASIELEAIFEDAGNGEGY